MTHTDIRTAILNGACDEHLDTIRETLRMREDMLGQIRAATLNEGDTVILHGLNPKYLNRLEATIHKINRTRAEVTFKDPARTGRFGSGRVRVPLSNLQTA